MTPTPKSSTKLNLLIVAFIFALFAAFVTPVMLDYNAWRWYVCGAFGFVAILVLYVQQRMARYEAARPPTVDPRRATRGSRIISGAGIVVFGTVVAMLFRDPSVDRKSLRFLIGFFLTSIAIFSSTFIRAPRDVHGDKKA